MNKWQWFKEYIEKNKNTTLHWFILNIWNSYQYIIDKEYDTSEDKYSIASPFSLSLETKYSLKDKLSKHHSLFLIKKPTEYALRREKKKTYIVDIPEKDLWYSLVRSFMNELIYVKEHILVQHNTKERYHYKMLLLASLSEIIEVKIEYSHNQEDIDIVIALSSFIGKTNFLDEINKNILQDILLDKTYTKITEDCYNKIYNLEEISKIWEVCILEEKLRNKLSIKEEKSKI